MGRWVEHDGTLGPLLTLATPDPGKLNPVEPRVAVDLAGVATVSWRNDAGGNPEIRLRRISPGSDVGPVSDKIGSGGATQIADLPSGATVVAWRGTGTELNTVSAGGTVGTAETISSTNTTADPELGVDQHGNGLVVWRDDDMAPPFTFRGARFDPTGSPVGGEITIDGEAEYLGIRSAIAADTAGNFLVAWVRYVPNKESVTYIRGIDPSGEFRGPPQPISAAGRHAEDGIAAAIDDQGGGAVAWLDYEMPVSSVVGRPIQSVGLPGGDLTELIPAPVEISVIASGQPSLGYAAFLARQRDAVVLRRFLEPPVCRDSEATVTQGRPVTISPSCTGAGIETTRIVSNPGHGTVAAARGRQPRPHLHPDTRVPGNRPPHLRRRQRRWLLEPRPGHDQSRKGHRQTAHQAVPVRPRQTRQIRPQALGARAGRDHGRCHRRWRQAEQTGHRRQGEEQEAVAEADHPGPRQARQAPRPGRPLSRHRDRHRPGPEPLEAEAAEDRVSSSAAGPETRTRKRSWTSSCRCRCRPRPGPWRTPPAAPAPGGHRCRVRR